MEQDNASLLLTLERETFVGSSRHVKMRFDFVLQQRMLGTTKPVKVDTALVLADFLTKPCTNGFVAWRSRILNLHEAGSLMALVLLDGGAHTIY